MTGEELSDFDEILEKVNSIAFLNNVIENIPDMVFVKDAQELRFIRFNKVGQELLGVSQDELLGKNDYDFFPKEQADFFTQKDREVLQGKVLVDIPEEPLRAPHGLVYLHTKKIPIMDENGEPLVLLGISENITERKLMQEDLLKAHEDLELRVTERTAELHRLNRELKSEIDFRERSESVRRETDRKLITLMGNLQGMAYRCLNDREWTMEFVSDGVVGLTGYSPEDLIFNHEISFNELIHPDDRNKVWQEVQKGIRDRSPFVVEYRIRTYDGQEKWVFEQGVGIFNEAGVLLALEGFILDDTERKTVKNLLEFSKQQQQIILDSVPAMIWYKDDQNNILRCNQLAAQTAQITAQQMVGRNTREFYPEDADKYLADDREVIQSGKPKRGIVEQIDLSDGRRIWLQTDKVPYRNPDGSSAGVIVFSIDITERMWAEAELQKMAAELARSNQELEQFAFIASHDLKEPVRKIETFAQLVLEKDAENLSEESKDYIERMRLSAVRMNRLIADLLDYSRIHPQAQEKENVDLDEMLMHAISDLEIQVKRADGQITRDPLPTLRGNSHQMHQLLVNLLQNALKFQKSDVSPILHVGCEMKETTLLVTIEDNGMGIDPEHQEAVFLPFRRLHRSSEIEGTGMGLPLCRRIMEVHGGTIEVESDGEQGTVFFLNFPKDIIVSSKGDDQ